MPRAAMSVATSTRTAPARKSSSARWRALCDLLPWIASAPNPARTSCSARRLAPCLVRVKTKHAGERRVAQDRAQQGPLVGAVDEHDELLGPFDGRCRRRHLDPHRGVEDRGREPGDVGRHRRREQQGLALGFGSIATILLTSWMKPMSSMRSASSSTKVSITVEPDMALPDQVEQPARRRHQDVDAARHRGDLRLLADAAEDDRRAQPEMAPVGAESCRESARPARGSGSAPGSARVLRASAGAPGAARRRGAAGSAARRRRSCRCRSGRCPAGRGRRGDAGSPAPGSGSARYSLPRRAPAESARRAQGLEISITYFNSFLFRQPANARSHPNLRMRAHRRCRGRMMGFSRGSFRSFCRGLVAFRLDWLPQLTPASRARCSAKADAPLPYQSQAALSSRRPTRRRGCASRGDEASCRTLRAGMRRQATPYAQGRPSEKEDDDRAEPDYKAAPMLGPTCSSDRASRPRQG